MTKDDNQLPAFLRVLLRPFVAPLLNSQSSLFPTVLILPLQNVDISASSGLIPSLRTPSFYGRRLSGRRGACPGFPRRSQRVVAVLRGRCATAVGLHVL